MPKQSTSDIIPSSSRPRAELRRSSGCPLSRSLLGAKRTSLIALHMSASDPKRTLGHPFFFLFELRPVPLDFLHKGWPDTPSEPNLIRSHGQNPLRRIDPARKKCSYRPITEPTIFKAQIPARFDLPSPQGDRRCLCGIHDPLRYLPCFKHHVPRRHRPRSRRWSNDIRLQSASDLLQYIDQPRRRL